MRIDRLDLTRYGRFTGASLPFGRVRPGKPDLHIVYGDNEAGKTTTYSALLDLFFGIEAATPYKFLHQAAALRIGGALDLDDGRREVIRLPKLRTLVDAEEQPLPDGVFSQDLAGLDRASYRTMFSLDEKTLAAGGESILASQGDLGHLLFSATAGLSDFSQALAAMRSEAEAFYKFHGRKHGLAELKRQLADLKDRRTAIDVMAAPFARLIATRDAADAAYEVAVAARTQLRADLDEVRRHAAALPRLFEWRALHAEHAALPPTPSAPVGWAADVAEMQRAEVELATTIFAIEAEIGRLSDDLEAISVDPIALSMSPRVKRTGDLRARFLTASKDLPDRRTAFQGAEMTVARILRGLDQAQHPAPETLLLRVDLTERLREAIESRSGTTAALREAQTELAAAQARQSDADAALAAVPNAAESGPGCSDLVAVLGLVQADDSATRLRIAQRECAATSSVLAERLAALAPWQGDVETLVPLDVPDRAARDRLAETLHEAEAEVLRRARDTDRGEDAVARLRAELNALQTQNVCHDDKAAAASRCGRDAAWAVHLDRLDAGSAASFAHALRSDDDVVAARFGQTSALAELRSVERALAIAVADHDLARRRLATSEERRQVSSDSVAARIRPLVGPAAEPLAALEAFVARRERALEARDRLRAAEADQAHAVADQRDMRDQLTKALVAAGVAFPRTGDLVDLIHSGRAAIDREAMTRGLRLQAETCRRDVGARRLQLESALREQRIWTEGWQATLQETWLAPTRDIAFVRSAIEGVAALGAALERRDGLADRITKMETDIAAYACEVNGIAGLLGIEAGDVLDRADRIARRIEAAVLAQATRATKQGDKTKAEERLNQTRPTAAALARRTAEMTSHFGVKTLMDVVLALETGRLRETLQGRLRALETEICTACATRTVQDADAILVAVDVAELERRRGDLDSRYEDQDGRTQELFALRSRAQDAVTAVDGDEHAARLEEERRTILLDIADRSLAHLSMRAGIIAAEGAINLYRDRHRSSMMEHASALFRSLSRGAYTGLTAQSAKDGEVLVGLPFGGGSKLSTDMSTATRNQLYLALRIAGYREFVKGRRPLPFVLDDVLETFDDDRAEAALVLLADMAQTGQVIYLTHHRHLCTIAHRVCPDATLHDLGRLA